MENHSSTLSGKLVSSISRYEFLLKRDRELIDRLNVFPVPDGDTGTNMYLTVCSVLERLSGLELGEDSDPSKVADAISLGSLLGARGNSGVILSQILGSFALSIVNHEVQALTLSQRVTSALELASYSASKAVLKPQEGTILTVARKTAEAAGRAVGKIVAGSDECDAVLTVALLASREALEDTPNLLEQLRLAQVVDSGGAGFVLFVESLLYGFSGQFPADQLSEYPWLDRARELASFQSATPVGDGAVSFDPEGEMRYEVMYLLEASGVAIEGLKVVWDGVGDSIVVVGQGDIYSCHIHTNEIGMAIEAGIDAGRVKNIRVTDLREQVKEEAWVLRAQERPEEALEEPHVKTAVVTVASGEGLGRILRSLGVQRVVGGGQSMNPSTQDLLDAIDSLHADGVLILPNNSNVIAVAELVASNCPIPADVLPTTSVMEGFAALMEYDPSAELAHNKSMMSQGATRVRVGEVTSAIRDGQAGSVKFRRGDWIGLSSMGIEVTGPDLATVVTALITVLSQDGTEIVTLIEGEGSSAGVTREITEWLVANLPTISVELHSGGQSLYPYLISAE